MKILRLVLVPILFAVSVIAVRAGSGDDWVVVQATGPMWVQQGSDLQRVSLSDGSAVSPGATLSTGPTARVMLRRGNETMIVGPETIMSIPDDSNRFYTTVVQVTGAIEFDVEKRNVTHFAVKTPLLAAVVKGTHFVVRAGDSADSLAVSRGRVEVQDLATGNKIDVLPGQQARVSSDGIEVSPTGQRAAVEGDLGVATDSGLSVGQNDGVSISIGGEGGVNVGLGGGDGVSASVGGPSGVGVSASAGSGVSATVGGTSGVGVSVGSNGVGVGIGGIGIGVGGR